MIAGGSEAALCSLGMASFSPPARSRRATTSPTSASRPWDKDRDGFVMAEGAGVVILEEYEHAKKRGARIYAELVGYGMSADAYHITAPHEDGRGAAMAMKLALQRRGHRRPTQVDYINAHGTSTPLGDLAETKAVKTTFGDARAEARDQLDQEPARPPARAPAAASKRSSPRMAIHRNLDPADDQPRQPRPECDLDYVPHKARDRKVTLRDEQQLRLRRAQRVPADAEDLTSRYRLPRSTRAAKMTKAPWKFRRCLVLILASPSASSSPPRRQRRLTPPEAKFTIVDIRNQKGQLIFGVFDQPVGFPTRSEKSMNWQVAGRRREHR